MQKLGLAGLVIGTLLVFAPAASAAVDPTGMPCNVISVPDPLVRGSRTGVILAALTLTDDTDPATNYTGYVKCTVQTGTNDTHAEADAAVLTGNRGPGPIAAAVGTVTYEVGADEDVYICTEVVTSGGTRYWDAARNEWSSSNTGACELVISIFDRPDPDPIGGELDPILCPILQIVFPPEGDVTLPVVGEIRDCPPYDI